MKKTLLTVAVATLLMPAMAQNPTSPMGGPNLGAPQVRGAGAEYYRYSDGEKIGEVIRAAADHDWCKVEVDGDEALYINLTDSLYFASANVDGSQLIVSEEVSFDPASLELVERNAIEIFAWQCDKYRVKSATSDIVIYATPNVGYTITPMPQYGLPNGIVLRVEKDGEVILDAKETTRTINPMNLAPQLTEQQENSRLPMSLYRNKIITSQRAK